MAARVLGDTVPVPVPIPLIVACSAHESSLQPCALEEHRMLSHANCRCATDTSLTHDGQDFGVAHTDQFVLWHDKLCGACMRVIITPEECYYSDIHGTGQPCEMCEMCNYVRCTACSRTSCPWNGFCDACTNKALACLRVCGQAAQAKAFMQLRKVKGLMRRNMRLVLARRTARVSDAIETVMFYFPKRREPTFLFAPGRLHTIVNTLVAFGDLIVDGDAPGFEDMLHRMLAQALSHRALDLDAAVEIGAELTRLHKKSM